MATPRDTRTAPERPLWLSSERINAADAAEIVAGDACVPLIEREVILPRSDPQLAFMDAGHDRTAPPADRTIAGDEIGDFRIDLEANRAAMAGPVVERHFINPLGRG
jgi:hypothetical protein